MELKDLVNKLRNMIEGLNENKRIEKFSDPEYVKLVEQVIEKYKTEKHSAIEIFDFINYIINNYENVYHQSISLDALTENEIEPYGGNMFFDIERNELSKVFNNKVKALSKTQLVYYNLFCLGYNVRAVSQKLGKPEKTVYKMRATLCEIFKEFKCYLIENKRELHGEIDLPDRFRVENR